MGMKYVINILFLFFAVSLFGQYPDNARKLRLGTQTTGKGLIYYGSGEPNIYADSLENAWAWVDTLTQTFYVTKDSLWQQVSTRISATPPLHLTTNSEAIIRRRGAYWYNSVDANLYFYDENVDAWCPIGWLYIAGSSPSNVAATGSTGAVNYTNGFWKDSDDNKMYFYNGSTWIEIGTGGTVTGTGAANKVAYWSSSTGLTYNSNFHWDNSNTRLGIGDSAPDYPIDLVNDLGVASGNKVLSSFLRLNSGAGNAGIQIGYSADGANPTASYFYAPGKLDMTFKVLNTSSALIDVLYFDNDGNIGIANNTSPAYIFDASSSTGAFRLPIGTTAQRPTGTTGLFRYNSSNASYEGHNGSGWFSLSNHSGTGSNGRVAFWTGSTSFSSNSNLFWDNSNNRLGIGTNSPGQTLSIIKDEGITSGNKVLFSATRLVSGAGNAGIQIGYSADGANPTSSFFYAPGSLDMSFRAYDSGLIDVMYFKNSGEAGFGGNTNPQYTVDITGTDAIRIPNGTTAQRPTGAAALLRFNSTLGFLEFHDGSSWNSVGSGTITGGTNLGSGVGVFAQANGNNLEFKSLNGGLNTLVSANSTDITITAQNDIYSVNGSLSGHRSLNLNNYGLGIAETNGLDSFLQATYVVPDFSAGSSETSSLLKYGEDLTDVNDHIDFYYSGFKMGFSFGSNTQGLQYICKGCAEYANVVTGTPIIANMDGTAIDDYLLDYAGGFLQLGSQSASPTGQLGAIHVDSDDDLLKYHNGTEWLEVQTDPAYGELHNNQSLTAAISIDNVTSVRVTGLTTGLNQYFTLTDSTLTYTGTQTKVFQVVYSGYATFQNTTGTGETLATFVKKNASTDNKSIQNITRIDESDNTEKYPFSKSFLISLAEDDVVDFFVIGGLASAYDIKLGSFNINITQL